MMAPITSEPEAEDPSDSEEDLGTTAPIGLSDDAPAVTPVTETVFSVLSSITDGMVIVQPPYQRRAFWNQKKKSALIESVYLGLPLPLIYLADAIMAIDGETIKVREVVDGQQRLTSLRDFYQGNLRIPDDSIISDLRGKTFTDLKPSLKQTFKDFKLSTATIPRNAKADKFELFHRLNQQSTVLSDQELRNAAHHGPYLTLLRESAEGMRPRMRVSDAEYQRMKDVEYLTRLLAFERNSYTSFPNKRLNKFLNDEMIAGSSLTKEENQKRIKRITKALERAELVFGDFRFRPYRIPEHGYNGEWARTVNRALMEVQIWAFLDHSKFGFSDAGSFDTALKDYKEEIRENVRRLHTYNGRFTDAIQRGTTGTPNVEYRFSRYLAAVQDALAPVDDSRKRRFFTLQQKQNIWDRESDDATPICSECGNEVPFTEAEVDHIKPFSEGGETEESNGQLIHRSCNRAKGARWDPTEDD